MKEYLEEAVPDVHIEILTASREQPSILEEQLLLPTCRNVPAVFDKVTTAANLGDYPYLYIHYPGHGLRKPVDETSYNQNTGDLALELLRNDLLTEFFGGRTLAYALNAMVQKGIIVTLVLDCCFSATVFRHGEPGIRYLP